MKTDNKYPGMSLIVKNTAKAVMGLIFLFGIYLTLYGHISPASGFSGGVVFACTFILMTLAFGKDVVLKFLGKTTAYVLNCVAALLFLLIASLGVFYSGNFFENFLEKMYPSANFRLFSAGVIPFYNLLMAINIGAGLFMVFIIFAVRRVVDTDGKRKLISTEFFDIKKGESQ
ncbi:MAG TPA: MnhB domain-containing protein [bacterium]|nr:MnhB domain-containing protein [bacterium]HPP08136.1 MnhB domain-containing protein [bacterium]